MPKVGVIMVGYKDYVDRFLPECRDSLRRQTYRDFKVYIVDNCSINDCAFVRENYPEAVCAARPDGNYAAANNLGMKLAGRDGCELFVIANMDTVFEPEWLEELVKAVESDPAIGAAQSKMLLYPGTEEEKERPRLNSTGNILNFLGFGFTCDYNRPDYDIEGYPDIPGYPSGCSFIIKKEVIDKIGDEDEELWMYHDDIEIGWKAKLAGYRVVLAPRSVMFHKYEFARSIRMLYYMERNRYLVMFWFYKLPTILLLIPAILAMEAGMILYSIPGKWFWTKMRATGYFFRPKVWRRIMKKRREAAAFRKRPDKEVIRDFEGRVLYQEIDNPVLKYIANPVFDLYWRMVKRVIRW